MYKSPEPLNISRVEIEEIAVRAANILNYQSGDRIESFVSKIGGCITYLHRTDKLEAEDGTLIVDGPHNFEIKISAFTRAYQDRRTIAHELGHYFLHSLLKKENKIKAPRFGDGRVEWEANWFAKAFVPKGDW